MASDSSSTVGKADGSSSPHHDILVLTKTVPKLKSKGAPSIELLDAPFAGFNPASISDPYDEDARKDPDYETEMTRALLDLVLEFHAWAAARPRHETATHGATLATDVQTIAQAEERQGTSSTFASVVEQTRLKLVQFVAQIKSAVLALASFGLE